MLTGYNDTYILAPNSGLDIITDTGGADTITFGTGLVSTDATFATNEDGDLYILFNDVIFAIVEGHFSANGAIETLEFDDNVTLSTSSIQIGQVGTNYGCSAGACTSSTGSGGGTDSCDGVELTEFDKSGTFNCASYDFTCTDDNTEGGWEYFCENNDEKKHKYVTAIGCTAGKCSDAALTDYYTSLTTIDDCDDNWYCLDQSGTNGPWTAYGFICTGTSPGTCAANGNVVCSGGCNAGSGCA